MTATLVVFCKRPKPGQGKQRLAATVGVDRAFELAELFLDCALEDASVWPGPVVLSPASAQDEAWALDLAEGWATVIAQPPGNLGERLVSVDRQLRSTGHQQVLIMGTDAPMLTQAHFDSAQALFAGNEVVLSAAADGGVTLMGSRCPWPDLKPLPWSTSHLGEALANACRAADMKVGYCAPGYDIDLESDLHRLLNDLKTEVRPARIRLFERLRSWKRQGLPETANRQENRQETRQEQQQEKEKTYA